MAPTLRTYGKKEPFRKLDKEDTFDKLFKTDETSKVFESSSDREPSRKKSHSSNASQEVNSGILESSFGIFDISDIGEVPDYSKQRSKVRKKFKNKVGESKKKGQEKSAEKSAALKFLKSSLGPGKLASSTPKILSEIKNNNLVKINIEKSVPTFSPIVNDSVLVEHSSPLGVKNKHFAPKNLIGTPSSKLDDSNCTENFYGFPSVSIINETGKSFYGFSPFSEKLSQLKKKISDLKLEETGVKNEPSKEQKEFQMKETDILYSNVASSPCDKATSLDLLVIDVNQSKQKLVPERSVKIKNTLLTSSTSIKFDSEEVQEKNKLVGKSVSLQNLNTCNLDEQNVNYMVKSSSFENPKVIKIPESLNVPCRINVQQIAVECSEFNIDSSDIEESVVNSADERSYSMRSGQMDGEESIIHSSDEEYTCGSAKERDSDIAKLSQKVDSYSAESEIAKSSDSIEVSRTANLENASSDVSTSSDKDFLKDDESGIVLSANLNVNEKLVVKETTNYIITRSCSGKSKDSSFYSAENSASDDSERDCEYESDGELSCESNKSSRRSSLESSKSLSRENLDQLRDTMSSLRIQDEYEDNICGKSRKSLTKRGTEWECPPSPRRSLFSLAPLFPLPENQEDPTDDSTQAEGSMCDSATASEEDSNQSLPSKSKDRLKDEFGRSDELGRSSGEDDGTKHSPVREASRLRRSRRLSRKSRETESKLNMVIEESDSESTEAEAVKQVEHIVLPTGKKFRRSLIILKHLGGDDTCIKAVVPKGRNYEQSVESIIKMQSRTGTDICEGRKSLMNKRKSLLSQCLVTPSASPPPRSLRSLSQNITRHYSPGITKRQSVDGAILEESIRRPSLPSASIREKSLEKPSVLWLAGKLSETTIREEEEEDEENDINETLCTSVKHSTIDVTQGELQVSRLIQETSFYDEIEEPIPEHASRSIVMKVCRQEEPVSFSDILYGDWEEGSVKVGEGVFGEVFMIPRENNTKNVIKIMPIEGNFLVNGEKQKKFSEICNELLIVDSLSELREENENFMSPGFAELVSSSIIKGKYPKRLLELWKEFDETRGSENESPIIFGNDQLYLVLELGNAGKDLESYSFSTAKQGLSVFKQTVCALAVAEATYEFEHRDLHWGNVLVSRTSERDIPFILNKEKRNILTNGVKATIIDFTLSRMTFPPDFPVYCDIGQDPDMFIGTGDYQFDVYRHMRDDVENDWQRFVPKTNVRWLHYLVDKMINRVKYQRKTAKVHTDSIKILKDIESWILSCDTSVEVALKIVQYK